MAITYSEALDPNAYRFIPDTFALTVDNGKETTAPTVVTSMWLHYMFRTRVRQLARDIRNAIQDGGLNEEGYAIDIPLWAECIEDITRAMTFIDMEVARRKEITFTLQYAGTESLIWTVSRVESAA